MYKFVWVSSENTLKWFRNQADRLDAHYLEIEKAIAEMTTWWLVMIVLHEHFSILKVAFTLFQRKTLLLESQSEMFKSTRAKLNTFHCLHLRTDFIQTELGPTLVDEDVAAVVLDGSGATTVSKLGHWYLRFANTWDAIPDMGFDARNLHDTVEDEEMRKIELVIWWKFAFVSRALVSQRFTTWMK
eukprot:Plantae.Rhodophyta-Palmaria_palmata.ctg12633.p1 GENE.Plantae.Rhodophyta-Palmaria_palmata.ctg12633~~Plantae.Rhodophyta-Palmaria_palmata.ctg12633.p1  ORF type:complete len:186 (-),score=22.86 Plantae.Rhodophyta-Palmaria_palmata.ctg12633:551-1108(-)